MAEEASLGSLTAPLPTPMSRQQTQKIAVTVHTLLWDRVRRNRKAKGSENSWEVKSNVKKL